MKLQKIIPYTGYGNHHEVHLAGSAVYETIQKKSHKNDSKWLNARRMLRNFYTKPIKHKRVTIVANGVTVSTKTDKRGYFEVKLLLKQKLVAGWHTARYYFENETAEKTACKGMFLIVGQESTYGVISDIDDTIVESYAYRFVKKLWVMLTHNETTRKTTQNISGFYGQLHAGLNPFFYVSSSERNLYPFWDLLLKQRGFPPGPLLLNVFNYGFFDLIFSGKGKHGHKYDTISSLLNFYEPLEFILVGDNGQKDVSIYYQLICNFPNRIISVYIVEARKRKISPIIRNGFKQKNIDLIVTKNLDEAISHAIQKGFISPR